MSLFSYNFESILSKLIPLLDVLKIADLLGFYGLGGILSYNFGDDSSIL